MATYRKILLAAEWRVGHRRWHGGWGLREVARVGHWGVEEGVGGRASCSGGQMNGLQ